MNSSFLKLPVDAVVILKLETKFIENTHRFIGSILNIICKDTMFFVFYVVSVAPGTVSESRVRDE